MDLNTHTHTQTSILTKRTERFHVGRDDLDTSFQVAERPSPDSSVLLENEVGNVFGKKLMIPYFPKLESHTLKTRLLVLEDSCFFFFDIKKTVQL